MGTNKTTYDPTALVSTLWAMKGICETVLFQMRLYVAPAASVVSIVGCLLSAFALAKAWRRIKGKDLPLCANILADGCTIVTSVLVREFLNSGLGQKVPLYLPHITFNWACKLWAFFWILSNSLSTNLLCLLAADRVYALCWPMHHRVHMTKRRYCMVICAFVLIFAGMSMMAILYEAYEYYGLKYCYVSLRKSAPIMELVQAYNTLFLVGLVGSVVLAITNIFLCIKILAIRSARMKLQQDNGSWQAGVRGARSLVMMACVYLLVSLPRAITYLIAFLDYRYTLWSSDVQRVMAPLLLTVANLFNYLFYVYCSVNWLLCGVRIRQFREAFGRFIGRDNSTPPNGQLGNSV